MNNTFVVFKEYLADTSETLRIEELLNDTEHIIGVTVGEVVPLTSIPLNVSNSLALFSFSGGDEGITYSFDIVVTTDERDIPATVAVVVKSEAALLNPYTSISPNSYKGLVGEVLAGSTHTGKAKFTFPAELDPTGGYIIYELLSSNDEVLAEGNCYSYRIKDIGSSKIVTGEAIVSIPSNLVPSAEGESYQIRWSIYFNDLVMYSFEQVVIAGDATVPLGTQPVVELIDGTATLELVLEDLYDEVTVQLFDANSPLTGDIPIFSRGNPSLKPYRVPGGYYFAGILPLTDLKPSLVPYTFIFKYWYAKEAFRQFNESEQLWVVTPSVLSAVEDVLAKVNKARTSLYGKPDLLYPVPTVLTWLRRGMDAFNGFQGRLTRFNMLNATGAVREYWLLFAELYALESQYLAEGEKAFDFQGEAISLSVDQTQYLETAAGNIRSKLESDMPGVKKNLIIKGQTEGDGDVANASGGGLMGAVGINITPASVWTSPYPNISKS